MLILANQVINFVPKATYFLVHRPTMQLAGNEGQAALGTRVCLNLLTMLHFSKSVHEVLSPSLMVFSFRNVQ